MSTSERIDVASILKGKVPVGTGSRCAAGSGPAAIPRPDCRSSTCTTAPASTRSRSSLRPQLPNYESEIKKLTSGCSVIATGALTAEPGPGAGGRDAGRIGRGRRLGRRPGHLSDPAEADVVRVPARGRAPAAAHEHLGAVARVRHCLSMAIHRYFHEHGFFWVHTPIITASDAEGAGEMFRVSTLDLANRDAIPRTPDGRTDFSQDFFGKEAFLTVSGQLNVETYCLRAVEGLHVRADVPRREQQHQPPPRRVLDGRARDRVRRSCTPTPTSPSRSSSTSSRRS